MRLILAVFTLLLVESAEAKTFVGTLRADVFKLTTCGVIREPANQSVFDSIWNYNPNQDVVDVPGKPGGLIMAMPDPKSGLAPTDKVVIFFTTKGVYPAGCPGGTGIFVLKNYLRTKPPVLR